MTPYGMSLEEGDVKSTRKLAPSAVALNIPAKGGGEVEIAGSGLGRRGANQITNGGHGAELVRSQIDDRSG